MELNEIHFHDSILLRVIENTNKDELSFEVDYPVDWESNKYEIKTILFKEILNYQVFEGPFQGPPTILSISIISEEDKRKTIRINTNAGYRLLSYKDIELK